MKKFRVCFSVGVNGYAEVEAKNAQEARTILKRSRWNELVEAAYPPPVNVDKLVLEEDYEVIMGAVFDGPKRVLKPQDPPTEVKS